MENLRQCRICMSESTVMLSIFDEAALWLKLTSFANIQIEKDDKLPQQICSICARDVINAAALKQKCEDADRYFRRILELEKIDLVSISSDDEEVTFKTEPQDETSVINSLNRITPISTSSRTASTATNIRNSIFTEIPVDVPKIELPPDEETVEPEIKKHEIDQTSLAANTSPVPSSKRVSPLIIKRTAQPLEPATDYPALVTIQRFTQVTHQCPICQESFAMKTILKHHMKQSHPEISTSVECHRCKRKYATKQMFDKHLRTGMCKKKLEPKKALTQLGLNLRCIHCHKVFPTRRHLGCHKRPGRCPAKRAGRRAANLKTHLSADQPDVDLKDDFLAAANTSCPIPSAKSSTKQQIHMNESQLALAKSLIRENADITLIAQRLNITENVAVRLRNSIVNTNNQIKKRSQSLPLSPATGVSKSYEVFQNTCKTSNGLPNLTVKQRTIQKRSLPEDTRDTSPSRKVRKDYVYIDDALYQRAKTIVNNGGSTSDVAKQLNISPMTAWRVRQYIIKNIPITFKKPKNSPLSFQAIPTTSKSKNSTFSPRPPQALSNPATAAAAVAPVVEKNSTRMSRNEPLITTPPCSRLERRQLIRQELSNILKKDRFLTLAEISRRLSVKGINLTPGTVCQKLKAMGLSRGKGPGRNGGRPSLPNVEVSAQLPAEGTKSNPKTG